MATAIGEWTRGPAIGRGSSATVSLAVDRRTGAVFAVKSVDASRAGELRWEHSILTALSSAHVVRCLGIGSDCDLFLEYAAGGSLADEIKRRGAGGACEEGLIRSRARDVLRSLAHAHAAGVAHCDVKARNVLVGADGRAILADFGCARIIGDNKLGRGGGTPMFMAPEAARGGEQGPAADVWALGCTVIEMATGGAPWWPRFEDPMAALRHVAVSGEAPECPAWMSEDARDFLSRCFRRDPAERWTAEQLLRHPFVATADSNSAPNPIVAEKELIVSPKSVLDQEALLWDDSTASTVPTDRVGQLAAGRAPPEWTWDASWIAVHGDYDDARFPSPEADDISSHSSLASGNPAAAEEAVNSTTHAWHGRGGDSYGDGAISSCGSGKPTDDSFRGGNHVVSSGCNSPSATRMRNGFFHFFHRRRSVRAPLLLLESCVFLFVASVFFFFANASYRRFVTQLGLLESPKPMLHFIFFPAIERQIRRVVVTPRRGPVASRLRMSGAIRPSIGRAYDVSLSLASSPVPTSMASHLSGARSARANYGRRASQCRLAFVRAQPVA
jgi:mitogen-activated protein kinase kinase kinase 17/18